MGFWIPIEPRSLVETLISNSKLDRPITIRRNGGQGTHVLDKYEPVIESIFLHRVMRVPGKGKAKVSGSAGGSKAVLKLEANIKKLGDLIDAEASEVKKANLNIERESLREQLAKLKG